MEFIELLGRRALSKSVRSGLVYLTILMDTTYEMIEVSAANPHLKENIAGKNFRHLHVGSPVVPAGASDQCYEITFDSKWGFC